MTITLSIVPFLMLGPNAAFFILASSKLILWWVLNGGTSITIDTPSNRHIWQLLNTYRCSKLHYILLYENNDRNKILFIERGLGAPRFQIRSESFQSNVFGNETSRPTPNTDENKQQEVIDRLPISFTLAPIKQEKHSSHRNSFTFLCFPFFSPRTCYQFPLQSLIMVFLINKED